MNRPALAGELSSPFEMFCSGVGGCYETIPVGQIHTCPPLWQQLSRGNRYALIGVAACGLAILSSALVLALLGVM